MIKEEMQNRRYKKETDNDLAIIWGIHKDATIGQLMDRGLSPGAAESFVFLMQYPGSDAMRKDIEAGLDMVSPNLEKKLLKSFLLPGFFKVLAAVTWAIFQMRIDPTPDAVKKIIPRLT